MNETSRPWRFTPKLDSANTAITQLSISASEFPTMQATAQISTRPRLLDWYRWLIILIGVVALVYATALLPVPKFDWRFLILTATMMLVSSRFSVQLPRVNTNITISDTFIFLVLLLYGGLAGILVAALEGLFSGLRISKRQLVIAFNSANMLG